MGRRSARAAQRFAGSGDSTGSAEPAVTVDGAQERADRGVVGTATDRPDVDDAGVGRSAASRRLGTARRPVRATRLDRRRRRVAVERPVASSAFVPPPSCVERRGV